MKKFLLLFGLFFTPFIVNAYDIRQYGYFQTIRLNNNNVMVSYYNNGWIDDDQMSSLQTLSANSNYRYSYALSTYGICISGSTSCIYNNLDSTEFKFFEQDICVSTNKIRFKVTNASGQTDDFATNNHPLAVVLDTQCDLYSGSRPSDLVGPTYWEWLGDYEGYIVKLFLPISHWKSKSNNSGSYFESVSNFYVYNDTNHEVFYKFLTSGGLYDHSRYMDFTNSFDLDTKNFDITYEAVSDGVDVLDNTAHVNYQQSKNLINIPDISSTTYTNRYYFDVSSGGFELEAGRTYTLSYDVTTSVQPFDISVGVGNTYYQNDLEFKDINYNGRVFITFTPTQQQLANGNKLFIRPVRYDIRQDSFTVSISNFQLEYGSFATSYCPYGVTLDNNCAINISRDLITWDSDNIFNNIFNILNLPMKLSSYVLEGSAGYCSNLNFHLFNTDVQVPCGNFFWGRADVQSFRLIWNLLFGGIIIFRLVLWNIKILTSVVDPLSDSVGLGIDLIDTKSSKGGE